MAAKKTALGAKFREYTSLRYGVTIQVYVDTRGWFSAEAFNETIHKATYAEVCQRIDELAAMFERLEWHFVMDVTLERYHTDPLAYRKIEARDFHPVDFLTSAGVRFEARRYYLGRRADKTWIKYERPEKPLGQPEDPWPDADGMLRAAKDWKDCPVRSSENFKVPFRTERLPGFGDSHGQRMIIPFDERTWQGMIELRAALIELYRRLEALTGTTDGQRQLAAVGERLLQLALPAEVSHE